MDFRAKSWGAKSWSLGRCLLPLLLILLCCLTLPAPLQAAVDIQITYDPKPGEEDEAPGWDPNGDQLVTMFNAAASVWEGYLIGNTTYHVPVSWDADLGDSTLGEAMPSAPFDIDILSDPMTLENNPAPWFVDSTPLDHSEFNFSGPAYNELPETTTIGAGRPYTGILEQIIRMTGSTATRQTCSKLAFVVWPSQEVVQQVSTTCSPL